MGDIGVFRDGMFVPMEFLLLEDILWFAPLAGACLAIAWLLLRKLARVRS